jgi:hypothetical protein
VKASWKLGLVPSVIATIQLQLSTSPPHSGGLTIMPSVTLSDAPFVSTMTLKALDNAHSLAASSPILEFRPSSL